MRLSCSYTEKLPRDKQPQVQELPGWEYNHCSFRMATLSCSGTWRFMGVRRSAHTSMSGRSALCQASYKLNRYVRGMAKGNNPQEFNSKRNSKCKRGLKAGHSSLLICLPIPHTAPALLSCIPVHWKSPVLGGFIKKLFCKAPMLLSRSRTNQKVSPSEETSKPKSNTRQLQKPKKRY